MCIIWGRHGALIVSALNSRWNSPGSSPGWCTALCSWARQFTLTMSLFDQVYKWVPANLLLGETLWWTSIPSGGSRNTPNHFLLGFSHKRGHDTGICSSNMLQRQNHVFFTSDVEGMCSWDTSSSDKVTLPTHKHVPPGWTTYDFVTAACHCDVLLHHDPSCARSF